MKKRVRQDLLAVAPPNKFQLHHTNRRQIGSAFLWQRSGQSSISTRQTGNKTIWHLTPQGAACTCQSKRMRLTHLDASNTSDDETLKLSYRRSDNRLTTSVRLRVRPSYSKESSSDKQRQTISGSMNLSVSATCERANTFAAVCGYREKVRCLTTERA